MIDVSVVIPCYNSADLIERRVREFEGVLGASRCSFEILLCDDGSRDRTAAVCQKLERELGSCRFIPSAVNRGRGRNVSDGFRQARGEIVGFADADGSTRAFYIIPILQALHEGCEVALAHRTYKLQAAHLPFIFHRLAAHLAYAALVRRFLGLRGHDTESGFKFFRREAALRLLDMCEAPGWFWDTEMIANAHALGYRVADVPSLFVRAKGMGSTVFLLRDSWSQFWSLAAFARKHSQTTLRRDCCR